MAEGVGAAQSCEAVLSFSQSREGRLAPIPLKLHTVTAIQVQEIPFFLQRMDGKQARSMGSKQCHGTAVPKTGQVWSSGASPVGCSHCILI